MSEVITTEMPNAPGGVSGTTPAATPAPAESAPAPAAPESLFDVAGDAAPPADGRPEWLPEQFWDEKAKAPKLEHLAKSWADLRTRIARRGDDPPASADDYRLPEVEALPEALRPAKDDPVWKAVRENALKAGVTQKQLEAIVAPYLRHLAEQAGAQADPAAQRAAYEAELARLGPTGRQVVAEVGAWLKGLEARGILTAEEAREIRGISTAEGVRALAKLRAMAGEKPVPVEALDPGAMSYADARRMMREALHKGDQSLLDRAVATLRELEARGTLPQGW
jgi:hypothetical protein